MNETFEEFLKKNADVIFTEGIPSEDTYISTRELGEWAWQECYKYCAKEASPKMKLDFLKEVHPVLLKIAIACLGKRKIKLLLHY